MPNSEASIRGLPRNPSRIHVNSCLQNKGPPYLFIVIPALEDASVREMVFHVSVETYHRLELGNKRTELIQGVIFNKKPKSPLHANTIRILQRSVQNLLKAEYELVTENPLTLVDSEPEPDLMITNPVHSIYAPHPVSAWLVIEISVTTKEYDRAKASVYAKGNVPVYWDILPEEKITVVRSLPLNGEYTKESHIQFTEPLAISLPNQSLEIILHDLLR